MSPDRGGADRLNELLDAVVMGDVSRPQDRDPDTSATVARFFAADDAPAPPPNLAGSIWETLMDHNAAVDVMPGIASFPPNGTGQAISGSMPATLARRGPSRSRWAMTHLATAALVVLTLVGSVAALRGALRQPAPGESPNIIPAMASTPERTPSPGVVADDVLIHATVEQLQPSGRTLQFALNRAELAPGAVEATGSDADNGVAADVFLVESGQVTVEADGPVFVTRAAASPLSAPSRMEPGTVITLAVGDQIYAPSGVTTRRRNDSPTPTVMFGASLGTIGDNMYSWTNPPGVTYAHGLPFRLLETLPTTPVAVTVRRQTLAPGGELAVRDQPGLELVYVEQGALSLIYAKPETPATPERSFTIRAGSGTDAFGRTPDQAALANRGSEPLVILTASVIPANAGEATPQAP